MGINIKVKRIFTNYYCFPFYINRILGEWIQSRKEKEERRNEKKESKVKRGRKKNGKYFHREREKSKQNEKVEFTMLKWWNDKIKKLEYLAT